MRFCVNKTAQNSRTFRRILAKYKMVVFCNSSILVLIPITLNYCFNFFDVVLNAPKIWYMPVKKIYVVVYRDYFHWHIPCFLQFSFQIVITFYLIFLPLFNSAIKGAYKVNNFALIFGLIYYYIRSSCLNDIISLYCKIL